MKTYNVSKHYDGNIICEIEANSEEEAIEIFEKQELTWTDSEWMDNLGLQDGDYDIWVEKTK